MEAAGATTPHGVVPQRFAANFIDLMTSCVTMSHMSLGCCARFATHLDADILERAVRLSLDAEPVLGSRLVKGWYWGHWQRLTDLDACSPFSIVCGGDPLDRIAEFQAEGVSDAGPQVRVRLVRHDPYDDLIVQISHVVADGQAATQYVYLLADLYTTLCLDPAYLPQPNLLKRLDGMDAWSALTPEQRASAKATQMKPSDLLGGGWMVPFHARTGGGLSYQHLVLPPERFRPLREYGRVRGATVNDMLLATLFRALCRTFDPATGVPLSFTCTVDHRRFLPPDTPLPISSVSMSCLAQLPYVREETFDDTLRRVVTWMGTWKERGYGIADQLRSARLARLGCGLGSLLLSLGDKMSARSGRSTPGLTNFGVVDERRVIFENSVPTDILMFGVAPFGGSIFPTISTYRETLTVALPICTDDMDRKLGDDFLSNMNAELPCR